MNVKVINREDDYISFWILLILNITTKSYILIHSVHMKFIKRIE